MLRYSPFLHFPGTKARFVVFVLYLSGREGSKSGSSHFLRCRGIFRIRTGASARAVLWPSKGVLFRATGNRDYRTGNATVGLDA